ncbi:MAG TPA: hypothetical protein VF179_08215 [Thermoanaerobaculia bacterium]|nr:hypothetical protein [Thermoanaerobaculia bacterium]
MPTCLRPRSCASLGLALLALLALVHCDGNDEPGNHETKRDPHVVRGGDELQENPGSLSPPIVVEPLYTCATAVTVKGFIPGARIDIFADGAPVGGGVSDAPWGQRFAVTALTDGQNVTATQTFGGVTSGPSPSARVRPHSADYPDGVPPPRIDPKPLYRCGKAAAAHNIVPGSFLEFLAENPRSGGGFDPPAVVGQVNGSGAGQWTFINPELVRDARVTARYRICSDSSPPSAPEIVQEGPNPVPAPAIDPEIYENGRHVIVRNVINGAVIDVFDGPTRIGGHASPGGSQIVRLDSPAIAGHILKATQTLCVTSGPSPDTPVRPCSELPAPIIQAPEAGDDRIRVIQSVLGSRILVFAGAEEVGDGGGPLVLLTRRLRVGEVVTVVQRLGSCQSPWVYRIPVACKVTEEVPDPSLGGRHAAGRVDYQLPPVTLGVDSVRLWATVRYPAAADGVNTALSPSPPSRFPLVVFLHGNHGIFRVDGEDVCPGDGGPPPGASEVLNHEGYDYVLDSLARGGFIAISINANDLNCKSGRIPERAALIHAHLDLWERLNDPGQPDPAFGGKFHGRVDLLRVGLAGHSRGGEAVVQAALGPADPDRAIRSVLSLAPVDTRALRLRDLPLLMILPAADGDVVDNPGARIYDRAAPAGAESWFKSQMYVHGAIHNDFNRQWLANDLDVRGLPRPAGLMGRPGHEAMLRAWSRVFFDLTLQGVEGHRPLLAGDAVVAGLENARVFPSYQRAGSRIVDHYEDAPDDAARNSLTGSVSRAGGFATFDEFSFRQTAGDQFNGTFFHDTDGLVEQWQGEASFASALPPAHADNSRFGFLSLRLAQVNDRVNDPARIMNVRLGLEDGGGTTAEVESAAVGVLPFPYPHPLGGKTMMRTLRIPLACFDDPGAGLVQPGNLRSVRFRSTPTAQGALALDDIELTN